MKIRAGGSSCEDDVLQSVSSLTSQPKSSKPTQFHPQDSKSCKWNYEICPGKVLEKSWKMTQSFILKYFCLKIIYNKNCKT